MFKNRFRLVLGLISLAVVSLAISSFRSNGSLSDLEAASDFYQRHPDWTWMVHNPAVDFPDYFQRHPERTIPSTLEMGASDYFQRHPELTARPDASSDLSEYYFRQQALKRPGSDSTDYYFRHNL
jgi:hypothetical protein